MKIHVKQCLTPPDRVACFEAGIGDVVLVSNGNRSYVEATICAVKSENIVVVSMANDPYENECEIPISAIQAVMLGS